MARQGRFATRRSRIGVDAALDSEPRCIEGNYGLHDRSWFDRAGNFHSDALHLTERYTLRSPDVIWYEVTIEDPKVFSRPWQIAMPLYRRAEPNIQLLEFRCNEFVEEFMYGNLRKTPLVKHWEGDTMTIDITRKVPPGDLFYQWYGS